MVEPEADAATKSIQLYGTNAETISAAVRALIERELADHIDLNMGCPVPKVTKKGGGAAIPWKKDLFADIISSAVNAARETSRKKAISEVPITVKMRLGLDDEYLTYLDAGEIAAKNGVAWVALHARTAAQMYSGFADWAAIGRLVEHLASFGVPVLGNGDIWTAKDALRMVEHTGCAGVVIGRGCLGRPWLFGQLDEVFSRNPVSPDPDLATVCEVMNTHLTLLIKRFGETKACRDFRKHVSWYLKGFRVGQELRQRLGLINSYAEFESLLNQLDKHESYPTHVAGIPRGRTRAARGVQVPAGWLDSRHIGAREMRELVGAELAVSGG
jgi:nifR3 family TIM-barrel protein